MITEHVRGLGLKAGINIFQVSIVEGRTVGCLDSYLLNISSGGHMVDTLVYQHDVDNLKFGRPCDRLNLRIRNALSRLKMLLKS